MNKRISIFVKVIAVAICVAMILATLCACGLAGGGGFSKPNGDNTGGNTGGNTQNPDCNHADANDDGKCDKCQTNVIVELDFYAINDLHGMYSQTETQPGVAGLTTYLKTKQESENAIVLASGDMWQGSSESNNTKGKLATEWLNYVNCSSMTLGNHEFDWSTEKIRINARLATFPMLAINVYEHATNQRATYCQSSVIVEKGGIKIGIIGAIGDCYSSISASMSTDVYFKTGSALTALIKAESDRLKEDGADYIALSIHDGYAGSSYDLQEIQDSKMNWYDASLSNGYVDVVFEGHTHRSYMLVDSYGVKHIQAGGYNDAVSHADVSVNIANGNKTTNVDIVRNSVYSSFEKDDIIDRLTAKYANEIGNPDEVVGYNGDYRSSDQLKRLMVQSYWEKGKTVWGGDYDIVLAGGYISVRDPYYLPSGNVTMRQIQTLFPFDNQMHLCKIKGRVLLNRYFNNKNYVYVYDEKIKTKLESGQGLNDYYYIVTDSYNTDYAPNKLTMVKTLGDSFFPRDCLAEYIAAGNLAS